MLKVPEICDCVCVCVSWVAKGQNVTKAWRCVVKYPNTNPKGRRLLGRAGGRCLNGLRWLFTTWLFTTLCLLGCAFYDFHVPHSTVSSQSASQPVKPCLSPGTVPDPDTHPSSRSTAGLISSLLFSSKGWPVHKESLALALAWLLVQALCYLKHSCATYQADTNTLTLLCIRVYLYIFVYISEYFIMGSSLGFMAASCTHIHMCMSLSALDWLFKRLLVDFSAVQLVIFIGLKSLLVATKCDFNCPLARQHLSAACIIFFYFMLRSSGN